MKSSAAYLSLRSKLGLLALSMIVIIAFFSQPMPSSSGPLKTMQNGADDQSLPVVDVLRATPHDPYYKIQTVGRLDSKSRVDLVAEVSGKVVELVNGLEVGQQVQKGDILFSIDDSIYAANVQQAKAAHDIAAIQVRVEEVAFGRNEKLYVEKAISDAQYDISKAKLASARASLEQASASLKIAETNLARTKVRAPFAGVITERLVSVGSFVAPGQKTLSMAGTEVTQIKVTLTAEEAKAVADVMAQHEGQAVPVTAHPNAGSVGNVTLSGKIEALSSVIDDRSRSAVLLTVFDNAFEAENQGRVFFGDFLTVDITAKHDGPVWTLPQGVLRKGKYVWIVENGRLHKVAVSIIGTEGELAIVGAEKSLNQQDILETLFAEEYEGMKVRLSSTSQQN